MYENGIVYLNNLISKKQNSIQDEELKNKLQILKTKINDGVFFEISFEVAIKLLKIIGVPENEIMDTYKKIISVKNYQYFSKEGTIELIDVEQLEERINQKL